MTDENEIALQTIISYCKIILKFNHPLDKSDLETIIVYAKRGLDEKKKT